MSVRGGRFLLDVLAWEARSPGAHATRRACPASPSPSSRRSSRRPTSRRTPRRSVDDRAEVRLVEVSGSVVTGGEVLPFRFAAGPDRGIPYPAVVVLLSEDDWARIERGELELPPGWGTPATLKKIA